VESLRSTHARVAALIRHRGQNDPEVAAAREELRQCKDATRTIRARVGSLPPARFEQLLIVVEKDSAGV
jgi:hypothetical protein